MVIQTLPKSIKIETDIPDDLWTVKGDSAQLHQVFLNLFVNARDAMPDGGCMKVSAENANLDKNTVALFGNVKRGPHVIINVADSGNGISPDIIERIFEPFFTTKEEGKGTGLGLATTLGIIKNHDGFIDVKSKVGEGSTFTVYLPAKMLSVEDDIPTQENELPRGHDECVLVIDDEASV
jgi:two-component system, cell cycle sensor histidine kinase and response regulator CckA